MFLAADTTTSTHLTGRIIPQSGNDLNVIGTLFSNFLAGKNQTLQVEGNTVDPNGNGQTVNWLSQAFQTLTLDVILPGKVFKVKGPRSFLCSLLINLPRRSLMRLLLMTLKSIWWTLVKTSNHPRALRLLWLRSPILSDSLFKLFSQRKILQLDSTAQTQLKYLPSYRIQVTPKTNTCSQLNLPPVMTMSGVSTGNPATLQLSFVNQTLQSLNNDAFGAFFAQVTDQKSADITLAGTANIVARTSIGDVPYVLEN